MADGFQDFLRDLFEPVGGVGFRRMFGGVGIFRDGLMFALATGDVLYLKSDDRTKDAFVAEGSIPFSFTQKGETRITSYWRLPERLYDEPDAFRDWALQAFDVALRADAKKSDKQKRRIKRL